MSEIARGVMGMPFEMAMGSDLSRRQFYSIAREVYAENKRLLESLQSMIDQTTPLVAIPGDPMWSRRVKIDELKTENELLTKAIGLQVVRRFAGDDDQKNIDELVAAGIQVDKELIAQINAENESLRKDAELYRQIERAASDLPNGWEIRVCVEKDAGYAELYDPDGCEVDFPNSCETLALTVSDAIDAAISSPENPS